MSRKQTLTSALLSFAILMTAAQVWAAIPWAPDLATAQQAAAQRNQLVLVHFWTPTCAPCRTLEQNVFSQPFVGDSISAGFVPVKVDASRDFALARRLGVRSWPTDVVLTPQGQVVRTLGCPQDPGQYVAQLREVIQQARTTQGGPPAPGTRDSGAPYANPPHPGRGAAPTFASNQDTRFAPQPRPPYGANGYQTQAGPLGQGLPAQPSQPGPRIASDYRGGAPPIQPTDPRTAHAPHGGPVREGQGYLGGPAGTLPSPTEGASPGRYRDPAPGRGDPADMAHGGGSGFDPRRPYAGDPSFREPYRGSGGLDERSNRTGLAGPANDLAPRPGQELPTGPDDSPPLGLEGHCPVTLLMKNAWKQGDRLHGAIHRGRLYLFVGPEEQQLFLERPDAFSPVLSGNDAVEFVDRDRLVPGTRRHGLEYNRKIYLFSSEASLEKFSRSPRSYAISVYQALQQGSPGHTSRGDSRDRLPR